jgi:hypothetical protein
VKFAAALFSLLPLLAAEYATYIGDPNSYTVSAVATDAAGNTYVTGWRLLAPAPIDILHLPPPTSTDIFLTKLDLNGAIQFTVTLGAKRSDRASAITLDPPAISTSPASPLHPISR